ncbi:hypothetical protein D9M71_763500 [compost metagenome]
MQLAESGQLPGRLQVGRRTAVAGGFLVVQHTAAQGGGDADHAVQLVVADETCPGCGDVQLVLARHRVARSAVHAFLIEEQADDLMAASQRRFGEAQGAAGSG